MAIAPSQPPSCPPLQSSPSEHLSRRRRFPTLQRWRCPEKMGGSQLGILPEGMLIAPESELWLLLATGRGALMIKRTLPPPRWACDGAISCLAGGVFPFCCCCCCFCCAPETTTAPPPLPPGETRARPSFCCCCWSACCWPRGSDLDLSETSRPGRGGENRRHRHSARATSAIHATV